MSRLVLVDDSTTIQKIVELAFVEETVEVRSFADPSAALDYLVLEGADIVLADLTLPGVNGYELCRRIRLSHRLADVPVVLLAGTFEPFDVQKAEDSGYSSSLTKPFEAAQLVTLVNGLLAESSAAANGDGAPSAPEVDLAQPLLFEIPTVEVSPPLFELRRDQCRPAVGRLVRIGESGGRDTRDLRDLIEKLVDCLPRELEKALPRLARQLRREIDD